jgi:hypothetical protein
MSVMLLFLQREVFPMLFEVLIGVRVTKGIVLVMEALTQHRRQPRESKA